MPVEIFATVDELNIAAAKYMIAVANDAIANRGRFIMVLSGGQTPKKLYALLATKLFCEQIPWQNTFVFWGDERCVPLEDERNNAYQAKTILLDKIGISPSHVHVIPVNLLPDEAACEYQKELGLFFGDEPPRFDLVLLGLGENGHTASLFPGTVVVNEKAEGVMAVYVEEEKMSRITMTAPMINRARHILFMVTGEEKSGILTKVLNAPYQPDNYPAQLIHPVDGVLYWFVDQAAAPLLIS